jgi:hypothetical protein
VRVTKLGPEPPTSRIFFLDLGLRLQLVDEPLQVLALVCGEAAIRPLSGGPNPVYLVCQRFRCFGMVGLRLLGWRSVRADH